MGEAMTDHEELAKRAREAFWNAFGPSDHHEDDLPHA